VTCTDITRLCVETSNFVQSFTMGMKKYVAPGEATSVERVTLLKRTPTSVAPVLCGVQAVAQRSDRVARASNVFFIGMPS
jgi:hypothetical protein